jgi:hypothetical protein
MPMRIIQVPQGKQCINPFGPCFPDADQNA